MSDLLFCRKQVRVDGQGKSRTYNYVSEAFVFVGEIVCWCYLIVFRNV